MQKTLLTSFATWKSHHLSNSSDDLLEKVGKTHSRSFHYLRKLPVDSRVALGKVLQRLEQLKPDILICCGMAERREKLSVESRAVLGGETIYTEVEPETLIEGLPMTEISHNAGEFVCNALYFEVLRYLKRREQRCRCIFVHVPVLTASNAASIQSSFLAIVNRIPAT